MLMGGEKEKRIWEKYAKTRFGTSENWNLTKKGLGTNRTFATDTCRESEEVNLNRVC